MIWKKTEIKVGKYFDLKEKKREYFYICLYKSTAIHTQPYLPEQLEPLINAMSLIAADPRARLRLLIFPVPVG